MTKLSQLMQEVLPEGGVLLTEQKQAHGNHGRKPLLNVWMSGGWCDATTV